MISLNWEKRLFFILLLANIMCSISTHILKHNVVYGLVHLFDFNCENNIPTFFSSFILLISASLLVVIAMFKKKNQDKYAFHWLLLSFLFLYLSVDESVRLHELLGTSMGNIFNLSGFFSFSWIIIGLILVIVFGISYFRFYFDLPLRTRQYFSIAAIIFIGGALGLEFIGGNYIKSGGGNDLFYDFLTTTEESLEMIGILFFIFALLIYIQNHISDLNISFNDT